MFPTFSSRFVARCRSRWPHEHHRQPGGQHHHGGVGERKLDGHGPEEHEAEGPGLSDGTWVEVNFHLRIFLRPIKELERVKKFSKRVRKILKIKIYLFEKIFFELESPWRTCWHYLFFSLGAIFLFGYTGKLARFDTQQEVNKKVLSSKAT